MEYATPHFSAPRVAGPRATARHPAVVLVEDPDPAARLAAHLELGRRAVARSDLELAETHFREAHALDPSDERPHAELRGLKAASGAPERSRWTRRFTWW